MCNLNVGHDTGGAGFLVDTSAIRELIQETQEATARVADDAARIELLKPAFARLLAADDWLPERFTRPDDRSRMGDGIGQYALYRAVDGSLCLFSLVVPPGVATPVHDHLAWGLVGVYRGRQDETIYRRLDDGSDSGRARLEVAKQQVLRRGEFYALLPPNRRYSLREDGVGGGVHFDPPPRQRHGLCLAAQVRSALGRGDGLPIRVDERAV